MIRIVMLFLLLHGYCVYAQQAVPPGQFLPGTSPVKNLGSPKGGAILSLGGGITQLQNKYAKDSAFMGNGWQLQGDVFVPLLKKAGLNVAVSYAQQKAGGGLDFVQQNYLLDNGAIHPAVTDGGKGAQVLTVTAGPQLHFKMGSFSVSPGLNAGYMNLSRDGYSISDSLTEVNGPGRKQQINFFATDNTKASGLVVEPRLKIGYEISKAVTFWAGVNYTLGPSVSTTSRFWQPLGQPKEGKYSYGQYVEGKPVTRTTNEAYKAVNAQAGLSFTFPGKKTGTTATAPATTVATAAEAPRKEEGNDRDQQPATAPVILTPDHHIAAGLHQENLHFNYIPSDFPQSKYRLVIWKIKEGRRDKVFEQDYPAGWNGVVAGRQLKMDASGVTAYEAQLTASFQPKRTTGANRSNKAQFAAAALPVYENNGNSNVAQFNMQNNCTVDHTFALDSTRCLNGDTIRIWGHAQILPNSAGVSTGTLTFDPTFLETTGNTTVTPVHMQPGNAVTVNLSAPVSFSFDVVGDMCNKQLRVFYDFSYQCPTLNVPAHIPCADTISLPCCICTYCEDPRNMNITEGAQSVSQLGISAMQVQQQFTVSPKNITKVTAQIVYMSETAIDSACRSCAVHEQAVYHFGGTNQAQWNGGGAINATAINSAHAYPSKVISWTCNNQGNLSLNMQLGLPGLAQLDCCSRELRICIRYSFTDKDCRTCERLVCYSIKQVAKPAANN